MIKRIQTKISRGKSGVTFVEVVLVAAILAVLLGIIIPAMQSQIKMAKNKSQLAQFNYIQAGIDVLLMEEMERANSRESALRAVANAVTARTLDDPDHPFAPMFPEQWGGTGMVTRLTLDASGRITRLVYTDESGTDQEWTMDYSQDKPVLTVR